MSRGDIPVTCRVVAKPEPEDHLAWHSVVVDGRRVNYGVAGSGLPVLFVHGWALGQHAYKRALKRLVHLGCRVYAPALPGFGGSAALPASQQAGGMLANIAQAISPATPSSSPAAVPGRVAPTRASVRPEAANGLDGWLMDRLFGR